MEMMENGVQPAIQIPMMTKSREASFFSSWKLKKVLQIVSARVLLSYRVFEGRTNQEAKL